MRAVLGPAAGQLLVLLAGHGTLRLAAGRAPLRAYGVPAAVGLSWLAGVATLGALTTLVGVLGLTTRPLPLLVPALTALALAGAWPGGERRRPAPWWSVGDVVALVAGVAVAVRVAVLTAGVPVVTNDEYALWMVRGRMLSQLGGLDPRVFVDAAAGYQHQEYPLFVPALVAWSDSWAGAPTDTAAHVAVALTLGALVALAGAVLTRLAGPAAAAAGLVLLVTVPTLADQSLRLMADVPVFAFAFGLALVLLLVLELPAGAPARPWLAAAALLGAGAVGTKTEGLAFAGIGFAAALLLATGRRRAVALAGAAAVAANLPWIAYARVHHLRNWVANSDTLSAGHVREVLPWTGHVARGMVQRWPGGSWAGALLAAGAVAAAVLAVRAGRGRAVLFLAAVVAADVAVLLGQYVVTTYGPRSDPLAGRLLESQLDVTVYRVALVPAALLAVAVPLLAGLALRRPAPAAPPAVDREPVPEPAVPTG